jgi:hypothetical protein
MIRINHRHLEVVLFNIQKKITTVQVKTKKLLLENKFKMARKLLSLFLANG